MSKKKLQKSYKCPYCKEKQDRVKEWQTCSVGYSICLDEGRYADDLDEPTIEGGDFENYACPNCNENLPNNLVKRLDLFENQ